MIILWWRYKIVKKIKKNNSFISISENNNNNNNIIWIDNLEKNIKYKQKWIHNFHNSIMKHDEFSEFSLVWVQLQYGNNRNKR